MNTERIVRIFAGTFVLLALMYGAPGSPLFADANFLWLAAFAGAILLQSGLTGVCPLGLVLRRLGIPGAGEPHVTPR